MRDFRKVEKHNDPVVKKTIVFFIIMIGLFGALSYKTETALFGNDRLVPDRNKCIYGIQREPAESIDVLVLGDSLSLSSVSPMSLWKKYGYTSYVCGQPGQKMNEAEELLSIALKSQKPRVVILETNALFCDRLKGRDLNDMIEALLNYHIPVFRGHDVWKTLVMDKDFTEENYPRYKGFAFRCAVKPYKKGPYMNETDRTEEIPDKNLIHMRRIMDMCRERGAELILLAVPSPANYTYERHNAIVEFAGEHGLKYIDLNTCSDEIGINWSTDFLDRGDHLNLSGAERVTEYLGRFLSDHFRLADYRADAAYDGWEKESREYEKKASEGLSKIRKGE